MLLYLLEQETKSIEAVRDSEEEVREILNDRTQEESKQELDISVYDTERNEKAKKHRRELVCTVSGHVSILNLAKLFKYMVFVI